jgi:hypothetical protein
MMNELQRAILRVLGDGEEPLDVAWREAGEVLGRDLDLQEFADATVELLERDMVQLWQTDRSGDRTEMHVLPSLLDSDALDSLELTLSLGPNAKREPPRWRIHVDLERHTFVLEADVSLEEQTVQRMHRDNPEVEFRVERRVVVDDRLRIEGSTVARNRSD